MNIRFLETAIALARQRSFKRAAEQLHCTQAAVSNRVAAIEEELGVRLFDRRFRDVVPTPAGERFLDGARDIVQRYEALVARMRPARQRAPLLRMGLNSSMAYTLLPDVRAACQQLYPRVQLDIATDTETALFAALAERRLDACLTLLPDSLPAGMQARPLVTLAMCWVAAPALLPDAKRRFAPRELAAFAIITTSTGGPVAQGIRRYVGLGGDSAGAASLASNSVASTVHMALQGAGIALVPEAAVQPELKSGQLLRMRVAPAFAALHYAVVTRAPARGAANEAAQRGAAVIEAAAQGLCTRVKPALARLAVAPDPGH